MSKCATPLEFADTKNTPATPLECALAKLLDLKSFRFRTYEKVGVSPLRRGHHAGPERRAKGVCTTSRSNSFRGAERLLWVLLPPAGLIFGFRPPAPPRLRA